MNWIQNMNRCVGPASWDASTKKGMPSTSPTPAQCADMDEMAEFSMKHAAALADLDRKAREDHELKHPPQESPP